MLHPAFAADSSTTPTFATPNYVNGAVDEIKTRIDNIKTEEYEKLKSQIEKVEENYE